MEGFEKQRIGFQDNDTGNHQRLNLEEPRNRTRRRRFPVMANFDQEGRDMQLYTATRTPELSEVRGILECMLMMDYLEPYDPDISDDELISRAARQGRADLILDNIPGLSRWSCLHEAVRTGQIDTLQALIDSSADVEARTVTGRTALHWAADLGDYEAVRLLLQAGAKADARTIFGLSPLEYASCHGHDAIFDLLLLHF